LRPLTLDRAALLFQAGKETLQADCRRWHRRLRCWQALAVALTLLTLGQAWHAWQDQPQIVERIRYVTAPTFAGDVSDDTLVAKPKPKSLPAPTLRGPHRRAR